MNSLILQILTTLLLLSIPSCTPKLINGIKDDTSSTATVSYTATKSNFISIWRTTNANETITLPLRTGFNYNFSVNWGDGSSNTITSSNDLNITHSYSLAGDYTVTISGLVEAWYFNHAGDRSKIIEVTNFGDVGWINLEGAFAGCDQLINFQGGTTTNVTNMQSMFEGAGQLTTLDLSSFNTAKVTNMNSMFQDTSSLTTLTTTGWNLTLASTSTNVFLNSNDPTIYCDQGGMPGTGSFFGTTCSGDHLSFSSPDINSYIIKSRQSTFQLRGTCSTRSIDSTTIYFTGDITATSAICT